MYAEFSVVRDGYNHIIKSHGIGARDCEFTNFADVLDKYSNQYGLPLQFEKMVFFWDKVGSTNCSPVRFENAQIIGAYLENYHPYYRVRLQDGNERICREIDLFRWF